MDQSDRERLSINQLKTVADKSTSTPLLKDLYQRITPNYAADWKVIGTLLNLPREELKIIEHDNYHKAVPCCNAMLEKWLEVDPSACWEKLFGVIKSSSDQLQAPVTSKPEIDNKSTVTDQGVSILSDRVREFNKQVHLAIDEDSWPPDQPKDFLPVLVIHHQCHHGLSIQQATALQLAGSIQSGRLHSKHCPQSLHQPLREALDNSKTTKQLVDILAPLQDSDGAQFILVEGLPGIGKSLLMGEIAYSWATGKCLQKFKLVLLIQLRSPAVQQVSLVDDLLKLFCKRDRKAAEIATASSDYLFKNGGKDVILLFDGYDEFPDNLQKNSLVADILKRQVLPHCGLVVSSRPHASVRLRQQATIRVDILGFAVEERKLYIEQSLKGQPHAVKELIEYLEGNVTINGLCLIPFNMVILIYLYKQGIPLPSNSTKLYNYFICLTICRHLAKSGQPLDNTITDISKLPQPYSTIIQQLSKLSLEGLNNNKLIFSLEEMRAACPGLEAIKGALNGFGLLQAVQHFGLAGETVTFNFVHFSIQEFLAAYHITQLPPDEELRVLEAKFWSTVNFNMFAMYISLTEGQRPVFKRFIQLKQSSPLQAIKQSSPLQAIKQFFSHDVAISDDILHDHLKSLRLFRCFFEANDEAFSTSIQKGKSFVGKKINLSHTNLTIYDVECITLFLIRSPHKEWMMLNLFKCNIQDHGFRALHYGLMKSGIIIRELNLSYNSLTRSSSSYISNFIIHCRVEVLEISGNHTIVEDPGFFEMLSHRSSRLLRLDMRLSSLPPPSAIELFTALAKGNKLQYLNVTYNPIADEACDVIATSLKNNTSLDTLLMLNISAEAAQCLVQALQCNNTLEVLGLPVYAEDVQKTITSLQEEVNESRERRGCQAKLSIFC